MAPVSVRNRSRSPRRRGRSGRSLLADPVSGLIDGDPGPDQEAIHQEREWDASFGPPRPTMIVVMRTPLPPTLWCLIPSTPDISLGSTPTTGGDGFHET